MDAEQKNTAAPETEQPKKKGRGKDKVNAEIERLTGELAQQQDQYQRMLAEYANYKRRTEQEKEALGQFTTAQVLTKMLPVLDNLERAAAAPEGEGYKAGVEMVLRGLLQTIEQLGVQEIAADGQPFDPQLHNAVAREDADGVDPDTVTLVLQKGYKMGERVLRPAMVKVAN